MIKANELRIGSLLLDGNGLLIKVESIMYKGRLNVTIPSRKDIPLASINLKHCKPIPLTEEILLKCGFKKDVDGGLVKNDVAVFLDKRFKTNLYLQTNESSLKFTWFGYECNVKHLHQLQNLYFALTNQELKIEL